MLYTFIDKKQNGKSGDSTKATPPLLDSGESGAPWVWLHGLLQPFLFWASLSSFRSSLC